MSVSMASFLALKRILQILPLDIVTVMMEIDNNNLTIRIAVLSSSSIPQIHVCESLDLV